MTVIENNIFRDTAQGITVGNPAYWTYLRNNVFSFLEKEGFEPSETVFDHDPANFRLLKIDRDVISSDLCGTAQTGSYSKDGKRKMRVAVHKNLATDAAAFIDANYHQKISLSTVASAFFVDKTYLAHVYSLEFGTTICNTILERRLTEAAQLLIDTTDSAAAIGANVGISDNIYFGKVFKRRFGVSPLRYRKEHLKQKND